jgi:hypothetical protein
MSKCKDINHSVSPCMDIGLIVVISIGTTALCCSFIFWLGERRAKAVLEANAREFREQAAQASATADVVRAEVVRAHSAQKV